MAQSHSVCTSGNIRLNHAVQTGQILRLISAVGCGLLINVLPV